MGGALYVLAEILLFLVIAAAIGFVIGRLTVGRSEPSGPLKRLSEVDTSAARSTEIPDQASDLRRRLGIAYQTIRELEEANIHLREAADSTAAVSDDVDEDDESEAAVVGLQSEPEETPVDPEDDATARTAAVPTKPQQGGPAELIRAAKAAKQREAGAGAGSAEPSEVKPESEATDG